MVDIAVSCVSLSLVFRRPKPPAQKTKAFIPPVHGGRDFNSEASPVKASEKNERHAEPPGRGYRDLAIPDFHSACRTRPPGSFMGISGQLQPIPEIISADRASAWTPLPCEVRLRAPA